MAKYIGVIGLCCVLVACVLVPPAIPTAQAPIPEAVTSAQLQAHRFAAPHRMVMILAWATWCPPCVAKLKDLTALRDRMMKQGVALLVVSVDDPDETPMVQQVLDEHGVRFPTFIRNEPATAFINGIHQPWAGNLPAALLYDGGRLLWFAEGDVSIQSIDDHTRHAAERARECLGLAPGGVCSY